MKLKACVVSLALASVVPTLARAAETSGYVYTAPNATSGYVCTYGLAQLHQQGDQIYIGGLAARAEKVNTACVSATSLGSYQMAVAYTLYKWDGSQQVLCGTNPGWPGWEIPAPVDGSILWLQSPSGAGSVRGALSAGCGAGYYNALVQSYYLDDGGVWRGGSLYSGWEYMNIPDVPPVK